MFTTGQTVTSTVNAQGLVIGQTYVIIGSKVEYGFGGSYTMYQIEDADGRTGWVANGHIVLEAVAA